MSTDLNYTCATCGGQFPMFDPSRPHVGNYGKDEKGAMHCPTCCGKLKRKSLIANGKGCLYLSWEPEASSRCLRGFFYPQEGKLSDWHGAFSLPIRAIKIGRHNIAGSRYDVWFTLNGEEWHGVQYGDNTQICHVRRLKNYEK